MVNGKPLYCSPFRVRWIHIIQVGRTTRTVRRPTKIHDGRKSPTVVSLHILLIRYRLRWIEYSAIDL